MLRIKITGENFRNENLESNISNSSKRKYLEGR
jgi:hypothetical protein